MEMLSDYMISPELGDMVKALDIAISMVGLPEHLVCGLWEAGTVF